MGADYAKSVPMTLSKEWIDAYIQAKQKRDSWQEVMDGIKRTITQYLNNAGAEVGIIDDKPVVESYTGIHRRIDVFAFREELPVLAAKFERTSERHYFKILGTE